MQRRPHGLPRLQHHRHIRRRQSSAMAQPPCAYDCAQTIELSFNGRPSNNTMTGCIFCMQGGGYIEQGRFRCNALTERSPDSSFGGSGPALRVREWHCAALDLCRLRDSCRAVFASLSDTRGASLTFRDGDEPSIRQIWISADQISHEVFSVATISIVGFRFAAIGPRHSSSRRGGHIDPWRTASPSPTTH